jgi:hypothetical protein
VTLLWAGFALAEPPLRYLAIGGGAAPEYTEVSLEQDLQLALKVLPGPGAAFFAGGSESRSVRVLNPSADPNALLVRLGDVFAPRAGRDSSYRRPALTAAAATLDNVEEVLRRALAEDTTVPLLVYIAAHGEQGEQARENHVALWGGETLRVSRLAELHDGRSRALRLLVASCYSGGFGELAFRDAQPGHGAAKLRCGLFAGPWDRQTSGCDPNPDRRAQEGYSIHVLHALLGQDRDGKALPKAEIDFDGDGRIGLLEAHTRARIASQSIDVPTSTSERFLREVEHRRGQPSAAGLPEEAAVIKQLGARLGLLTKASAEQRWKQLSAQLDRLDERLNLADDARDRALAKFSAQLLARWPVLDDPYHPEFAALLQKNQKAISALFDSDPDARDLARNDAQIDDLTAELSELEPQEAAVLRLLRAYETASLAASLKARGGANYQQYRALLECERGGL